MKNKKTYYYSRISTVGQNSARQIANFKKDENYNSQNVFVDKVSGVIPFFERKEACKLFDIITENNGDSQIIVDSIDRLGRNLIDVLNTIEVLTKNKISVKSLKEGFETLDQEGRVNPLANIVISVMGSIAQMERERLRDRQTEGIAVAKASGKYLGRKVGSIESIQQILAKHSIVVEKLRRGYTIREIAELTSRSSATVVKVKKLVNQTKTHFL